MTTSTSMVGEQLTGNEPEVNIIPSFELAFGLVWVYGRVVFNKLVTRKQSLIYSRRKFVMRCVIMMSHG